MSGSNTVPGTVIRGGRRQLEGEEGEEGKAEGRTAGSERRKKGEKGAECEAEQRE